MMTNRMSLPEKTIAEITFSTILLHAKLLQINSSSRSLNPICSNISKFQKPIELSIWISWLSERVISYAPYTRTRAYSSNRSLLQLYTIFFKLQTSFCMQHLIIAHYQNSNPIRIELRWQWAARVIKSRQFCENVLLKAGTCKEHWPK